MSGNYGLVSSVSQFEAFVDRLLAAGSPFGFDLETGYDGPDTAKAAVQPDRPESKIVGFSFSGDPGWARYLALADSRGEYLISSEVVPGLWRLLRSGKAVAANAKFEARWTARLFREWAAGPGAGTQEAEQIAATQGYVPWHADTMLMSYVAAEYPSHGLKFLTQEVFSHDQAELLSLFPGLPKNRSKSLRFNALELTPAVVSYACEDAAWTLALYRHFLPSVKDSMIYKTEMAIMPILARMEDAGIVFDWSGMVQASREVGQFLVAMRAQVMADLSALVGHEVDINLGSPAQVGKVLYEDLGLPVSNRTATGNPSTDAGTLGMLADRYPVVQAMLDFKEVSTLQARYLTKFPAEFNYAADGRAHPNHMQAVVPSGRFSVNDPGYQQLPKKYRYEIATDNEGLEGGSVVQVRDGKQVLDLNFRNFVGSPQGARIIGFDYSQVELRVLAGESGEPALLRAFESGADVHKATAALLFGVGVDQVSPDQRQQGKALADDELVLTPDGWTTMGQVRVGDEVVVPSGGNARVEGVFPQGQRQLYRVAFSDGTSVEADADHLWTVYRADDYKRGNPPRVHTTQQIMNLGLFDGNGRGRGGKNRQTRRWLVDNVAPLEFRGATDLPLDPYVLGVLLGDGSLSGSQVKLSSADVEIVESVRRALPEGVQCVRTPGRPYEYRLTTQRRAAYSSPLDGILKGLGLRGSRTEFDGRWGVEAGNKFVPADYLFAGADQRLEVLRGLLDTDGTTPGPWQASFTTVSEQLRDDVEFLARSLGGFARTRVRNNPVYQYQGETRVGRRAYTVRVMFPGKDVVPFRLSRKARAYAHDDEVSFRRRVKRIVSITATRVAPATCIAVNHPDREFVTSGMTRTHNTMNFSLMYGAGPKNLSEQLRISLEQARELYDTYFRVYSSVGAWKESQVAFGRQQGFVRTKFGRKIVIREFGSPDSWIQAKGERLCVNAPIQGSAADYMKIAMVRADAAIKSAGLQDRVQLVMNIHDALEFYVSDEIATADLIEILSPAVSFPVPGWPPILAEWHEGQRWGEVRDIDLSEISSAGTSSGQAEQSQTTERDSAALEPQGVVEVRRAQESPLQVDAQAVEQGSEGSAQTVYVDLEQLPYETEYRDFLEWARSRPGTANVVVRVEGQEVKVGRFALSISDSGEVATILTGARIVLGAGSVDRDALAGSIDF